MTASIKGRRCILFARGADDQTHSSIKRQKKRLRDFAHRRELHVVDDVTLKNISALSRETTTAVDALLARKEQKDDFDLLVIPDLSRISRGGICHTMQVVRRLTDAGVSVATLDNGLIDQSLFRAFRVRVGRPPRNLGGSRKFLKEKVRGHEKESGDQHRRAGADGSGGTSISEGD